MCDDIKVRSESNRFFKMKCYKHKSLRGRKDMEDKFQDMIQELIDNFNLDPDRKKYKAFDTYIDDNYDSFSDFSKDVVRLIYTRFQEEAIPTMKFVFKSPK